MASLGLALVGGALLFTGAGAVAAPYFFVAAATAGVASGAASIANELNKDNPNPVNIGIDVLLIAGSILGAGAAAGEIRAGVQAARAGGLATRGAFISTKMGRFLVYSGFATDAGAGVLIGAQGVAAIDAILSSNLSREEKIAQISRTLAVLAVQGGLLLYGARNLQGTKATTPNARVANTARPQEVRLAQATNKLEDIVTDSKTRARLQGMVPNDGLLVNLLQRTKGTAQLESLLKLCRDPKILSSLLNRIPDPLVLKELLLKTQSGKLLNSLLKKHPLNAVKHALNEIDPSSIKPKFVEELVDLMIKYPVPGRKFTAAEMLEIQINLTRIRREIKTLKPQWEAVKSKIANLRKKIAEHPDREATLKPGLEKLQKKQSEIEARLGELINGKYVEDSATKRWVQIEKGETDYADTMYQGRKYKTFKELTPEEAVRFSEAENKMQNLLMRILNDSDSLYQGKYVVRITGSYQARQRYFDLKSNTYTIKDAYMTNILPDNALSAATGAQLKPEWYWRTEGLPEVAMLIPRKNLTAFKLPQASGQKAGGMEFTTSAYPGAGKGGVLQFIGEAVNVPKDEVIIIDLAKGTRIRW
jgi:hypothetical protein